MQKLQRRVWIYWTNLVNMKLPGRMKKGRPQRRFMDVTEDDMYVEGWCKKKR